MSVFVMNSTKTSSNIHVSKQLDVGTEDAHVALITPKMSNNADVQTEKIRSI